MDENQRRQEFAHTDGDGSGLWNGRIDELALFDQALGEKQIADLYQVALEETAESE